jgi:hypothetical protein
VLYKIGSGMGTRPRLALAVLCSFLIAGCISFNGGSEEGSRKVIVTQLYAANSIAQDEDILTDGFGDLRTRFFTDETKRTTMIVDMPSGEALSGRVSFVSGLEPNFGNIFASVSPGTTMSIPGGIPSIVSLVGTRPATGLASLIGASPAKGTSIRCEFYIDIIGNHGRGACRSSKGGLYRLNY